LRTYRKAPVVLFFALFSFWVLFTGRVELSVLAIGIVLSMVVTRITWRTFFSSAHEIQHHVESPLHFRLREAVVFFPFYAWNIFKATAQVAFLALRPRIELMPGIIKVETGLKNKTTLVILANQITLTPGTLTVDTDITNHSLFVHSLNLSTLDACSAREEIRHLEERLRRLME